MKSFALRIWVGVVLFLGNLAVIGVVVFLTTKNGFTTDQQKMLLLVIGPMTVPNVVTAIRYCLREVGAESADDRPATLAEKIFGLGPAILFPLLLIGFTTAKAFNTIIRDFNSLLTNVALLEGAFGGTVALVMKSLFEHEE
jgi:hypothetical protein